MSFSFNGADLGSPLELWKAWTKLDGELPQLRYVPYTDGERMPKAYLKAVKEQAYAALQKAEDAHLVWVLKQILSVL